MKFMVGLCVILAGLCVVVQCEELPAPGGWREIDVADVPKEVADFAIEKGMKVAENIGNNHTATLGGITSAKVKDVAGRIYELKVEAYAKVGPDPEPAKEGEPIESNVATVFSDLFILQGLGGIEDLTLLEESTYSMIL